MPLVVGASSAARRHRLYFARPSSQPPRSGDSRRPGSNRSFESGAGFQRARSASNKETAALTSMDTGQYLPRLDHSYFEEETRPHLGAVLLKSRLLQPEQLDEALNDQAGTGKRLGEILVE